MPTPSPNVRQAPRLTTSQIAEFKREGFLVLPGVIDPELCRQARDQMWETIAENRPSMKRDDPSTWTPIGEEEAASYKRPEGGGDPYFWGGGHRFYIRNGAEDLLIDIGARSVWDIAEQLLGKGEVVWPAGADESGFTTGPCLMTQDAVNNLSTHLGPESKNWPTESTGITEELRLPKTGPVWLNGQGTRGMYCTLPNSPFRDNWGSAHSEGLYEGRWLLQTAAYFDDLPPNSGGLTLWPRSHTRIWSHWKNIYCGASHNKLSEGLPRFEGYTDYPIDEIKSDTPPAVTHGPVGSVVLWHANMLHMAGVNTSNDVIRQATLYAFLKTQESLSDELATDNPSGDIWRDWSDEVRVMDV